MKATFRHLKFIFNHRCKLIPSCHGKRFCSTSTEKSSVKVEFKSGNSLTLSPSEYARFTDGCAIGRIGNTTVMVTAISKSRSSNINFLPLVVDYRQKAAAAGRIPTNFLRRELGPTENEILTGRLIDRSLRPLFPPGFTNDTQVMCNLLAVDGVNDPDVVSINAASTAVYLSDIPWNGPIGAVRVGMIRGNLIINPTRCELANSDLNLIVVAAEHNLVVMLEGGANNLLQSDFLKAIKFGVSECQSIIQSILKLKSVAKPKRVFTPTTHDENVIGFIKLLAEPKLKSIFLNFKHDKISRDEAVKEVKNEIMEKVESNVSVTSNVENYCSSIFDNICKEVFRTVILENKVRCDGRDFNALRNISCKVDLYPPLHGSALFQRGQTQVLCTVALDSLESAMKLDPMSILTSGLKEKNFFLHYEFPPYATNDIGRSGPAMRREIGHGALAERALRPVIPANYPFTIRLTSEVLESNGSSSMASVCGGSLALMDAGVPILSPVAGVAIGVVTDLKDETKKTESYQLLTDILGIEDFAGDMDFKMAGSRKGITAIQADIKLPGLPLKIIMEAVTAAYAAKSKIIDIMDEVMPTYRTEKKDNWPVTERLEIEPHKRGKFLGPGGINLKKLMLNTGVQVTPEDDNIYSIFAPNRDALVEAKEQIEKILKEPNEPQLEFGGIYKAKIVEIREIGVMVSLYDNMVPALLHNSQLDQRKISHPEALGLKVGDEIHVKYFGRDPVSGVIRLSRKVLYSVGSGVIHNLK